ncbi:MAG: glutaminyl-peptide cyclotransferase [Planctomycetaceae bacterium]|nr:glutaminyl-peptide cyclotransferase [Planctomycetaceae bacterium]MCP4463090.1 glutaminyl-peptide cyclotransferase [Planctomycetaceae bacterium]
MAKQKPIRNEDLNSLPPTPHKRLGQPDLVFGVPRQRLSLTILFLGVTIGSFIMWAVFQRPPLLDEYTYEVVAEYPHDTASFTQGLVYRDGYVYESTGRYGQSKIRKIKLEDGTVVKEKKLDDSYFGEGLTLVDDKLVQLTWKENTGFVYDLDLNPIGEFNYEAQGWGLTFDGRNLIMSDGTSKLTFLDPETFTPEKSVFVRKGNTRMPDINELEWVNGTIFANIFQDDMIYLIQPMDGKVMGRVNFQKLYPRSQRTSPNEDVMNGIAIQTEKENTLLVTGKNWPKIYEVKLKKLNPNKQ